MGVAIRSTPPPLPPPPPLHVYPQELQLKLYQAFIFSIPILFSIILFLLFYLFYLKRRASSLSPSRLLPTTSSHSFSSLSPLPCRPDLTVQFLDKLPKVFFDEDLRARDSQCCVCLGDFEMKEELLQIPYCKHVFHIECIHRWLQSKSNSTCPLCRCSIIPTPTAIVEYQTQLVHFSDVLSESESPQQATTIIISSSSPLPPHQQHHAASSAV